MRTPRYQAIADELRQRISSDEYTAGRLLPSEANLSDEFSVSRVTIRRALEQLRDALGERDEIIEGIEIGMLPASLEVTLAEGVKDVAAAHPVVDRLAATAGVEEVEFLGEWVDDLTAFLGGVRGATAALFIFVTIACIAIIWAAMRLGMRRRNREAEIVELCGGIRGAVIVVLSSAGGRRPQQEVVAAAGSRPVDVDLRVICGVG